MPDAPALRLRTRLRAATADTHARVDALMGGGFGDERGYRAYLGGMHAFVVALLPAVREQASALRWELPAWDALLRQDMAQTGAQTIDGIAPLPGCDRTQALGALYVLEGAALGARMLVRQVQALGHGPHSGARFLHAHADGDAGQRWPRFLALLESEHHPSTAASACATAQDAFLLAELCLRSAKERLQ